MSSVRLIFQIFMLILLLLLQIFLSKRQSKWPGLVLPILAFLFGMLYPLNLVSTAGASAFEIALMLLLVWIIGNIPTFILLAIYFGCRRSMRNKAALDRTKIQDLE